jgi:hypothetical protein
VTDLSCVPWRASAGNLWAHVSQAPDILDVHIGGMSTPMLADRVAAEHNAELIRRQLAQHGRGDLAEVFAADVPEGGKISGVREETLPARTWEKLGADGVEIYLDSDQDGRLLVRTVTARTA